jgi:hypothetical protein
MCFGQTQTNQTNTSGTSSADSTGTSSADAYSTSDATSSAGTGASSAGTTTGGAAGTTSYTANSSLYNQALQNLGYYNSITGNMPLQGVANFSNQQQASFDAAGNLLNSGVPYLNQAAASLGNFTSAATPQIGTQNIAGMMSPFMNQYVGMALQPQIQGLNQQFAAQDQNLNSQATASGAFGDSRAGVQAANLTNQQNQAMTGLLGQAYTSAFNTALGGASQQASLNQQGQTTNAQLQQQAIQNQLAAAAGYAGLGNYALGSQEGIINLNNTYGAQQTSQTQAGLNALFQQQYTEPLSALGVGDQALQVAAGVIPATVSSSGTTSGTTAGSATGYQTGTQTGATSGTQTGTTSASQAATGTQQSTTYQPNNWGLSLLGTVAGGLAGNAGLGLSLGNNLFGGGGNGLLLSDERLKEDIHEIGELADGQQLYSFRYRGDPTSTVHVGLMAQEVEQIEPDAVSIQNGGYRAVDYGKATWLARALAEA